MQDGAHAQPADGRGRRSAAFWWWMLAAILVSVCLSAELRAGSKEAGEDVWLADLLPSARVRVQGTEIASPRDKAKLALPRFMHRFGDFYHVVEGGDGLEIEFTLPKAFGSLCGVVGTNVIWSRAPSAAAEFQVFGNDKLLWKSQPLWMWEDAQSFCIDLKGVSKLKLVSRVNPLPGRAPKHVTPHWIDPRLEVEPPNPRLRAKYPARRDEARLRGILALEEERYADLDAIYQDLVASGERFGGAPLTHYFCESVAVPHQLTAVRSHQDWQTQILRLQAWSEKSRFPHVVKAMTAFAMTARALRASIGNEHERDEELRKAAPQILAAAERLITDAVLNERRDAYPAFLSLLLAPHSKWDVKAIRAALKRGTAIDPEYAPLYTAVAEFLVREDDGDALLRAFAAEVREMLPGPTGEAIAARIALAHAPRDGFRTLEIRGFRYADIKPGLEQLLSPGASDHDLLLRMAAVAHAASDSAVVLRVDEQLDRAQISTWGWRSFSDVSYREAVKRARRLDGKSPDEPEIAADGSFIVRKLLANVSFLAFDPRGETLWASGRIDRPELAIWDAKSGALVRYYTNNVPARMRPLGHDQFVAITDRGDVLVVPYQPPSPMDDLRIFHFDAIRIGSGIPTGSKYYANPAASLITYSHGMYEYNPAPPKRLGVVRIDNVESDLRLDWPERVYCLRATPDASQVIVAGAEGQVTLHSASDLKQLGEPLLPRTKGAIYNTIEYTSDGKYVLLSGFDSPMHVFRLADRKLIVKGQKASIERSRVALSPRGDIVAVGRRNGEVVLCNLKDLKPFKAIPAFDTLIQELAFSPDGNRLAAGVDGGAVRVWDLTEVMGRPLVDGQP